jgi:hypothetical protein
MSQIAYIQFSYITTDWTKGQFILAGNLILK